MKIGFQREENSNHVAEQQRVKTELPEVNLTADGGKEQLTVASASKKPRTAGSTTASPMPEKEQGTKHKVTDIPSSRQESALQGDLLSALSDPPGAPDLSGLAPEMLQGYISVIFAVKTLISFVIGSNPTNVAHIINQANNAFLCLKGLNADYQSFYTSVHSYTEKCSELCKVQKELEENMQAVKLLSRHEKFVCQSNEAARAVSEVEADLQKAKKYMAPLQACLQDTRELLQELELELGER
eukprot:XP_025012519.1 uncharacterized protein LOC112534227 [Ricinus communis]